MSGHVRPHGPGRWRCVAYAGRGADGKPRYVWETFHGTEKQARKHVEAMAADIAAGRRALTDGKITVLQWLERWLETKRPNVAGKTWERYDSLVRQHIGPAIGHHRMSKLTALQVEAFYTARLTSGRKQKKGGGLSPVTIKHIHALLRTAFRDAKRLEVVSKCVIDDAVPPRAQSKEKVILTQEQAGILAQALEEYRARKDWRGYILSQVTLLALFTGVRRGEVLGIRWQDIDFDGCTIAIKQAVEEVKGGLSLKPPKTERSKRTISVPPALIEVLRQHRTRQNEQRLRVGPAWQGLDLVCANEIGGIISPDAITKMFGTMLGKLKLPTGATFHSLRHTHATFLLEIVKASDRTVSERLGHASPAVTKAIYGHRISGADAQASEGFAALIGTAKAE